MLADHPWERDSQAPRLAGLGFLFIGGIVTARIVFLVDGFNLYHSVVDLYEDTGENCR